MGNENTEKRVDMTFCPECDARVEASLVPADQEFTCGDCGCRFWIGPIPFGYGYKPQVLTHGDRWRRFRVIPSAEWDWCTGGLGISWGCLQDGLDLFVSLGPLIVTLYFGPGLARG